MEDLKLPPVAKNVLHFCRKCDAERYHRVLAHISSLNAKLECEVCKSKATLKVTEPKAGRKMVAKSPGGKKKSPVNTHKQMYQEFCEKVGLENPAPYNIRTQFSKDAAIQHPKFGVGFVTQALTDKIEVCFEDSARLLIHNRNQ